MCFSLCSLLRLSGGAALGQRVLRLPRGGSIPSRRAEGLPPGPEQRRLQLPHGGHGAARAAALGVGLVARGGGRRGRHAAAAALALPRGARPAAAAAVPGRARSAGPLPGARALKECQRHLKRSKCNNSLDDSLDEFIGFL